MKKLYYSFIVVGIATFVVVGLVGAYSGNADVVVEGNFVESGLLGSGGRVVDSSSADFTAVDSNVLPDTDSTYDIGAVGNEFANLFADTMTGTTGNFGNGSATTTIVGGASGSTTSTFAGDVSIPNLFSGLIENSVDNGLSDGWNVPVSASATTGTYQGINFNVDGLPVLTILGKSDAQGLTWGNAVVVGGGSTASSTLEVYSTQNASSTSIAVGDGMATSTNYGSGLFNANGVIYQSYPNGMCAGEDTTTTTPNLTFQLCTSF